MQSIQANQIQVRPCLIGLLKTISFWEHPQLSLFSSFLKYLSSFQIDMLDGAAGGCAMHAYYVTDYGSGEKNSLSLSYIYAANSTL